MAEITGTSGPVTKIDVLGGVPGAAGVSVTTAELDADGHLIIGKSNGVTTDVGQVKFDVTPEVQAALDGAVAAETEATTQAGIATGAASNAKDSETKAAASAAAASGAAASEAAAKTSETNAALSATNAAGSATTATTKAGIASSAATAAATSASNAALSESAAATSESIATTAASNAATSESNAANSESHAASSASAAAGSATAAGLSATAASGSANAAAGSASSASGSATAAATSAGQAAGSATAASGSAEAARLSAQTAEGAAVTASEQAGIATDKAGEALGHAATASEQAGIAVQAALDATTAAANALPEWDATAGEYAPASLAAWIKRQRDGKLYGVSIPTGLSVECTKTGANAGIANPTPGVTGTPAVDPYSGVGSFFTATVNATVDADGVPHVTAFEGDANFSRTENDTWVLAPVLFWRWDDSDSAASVLTITDVSRPGFDPQPKAKLPNGELRPYMLYAKYALSLDSTGTARSVSGAKIQNRDVSHNTLITQTKTATTGYAGKSYADDWYVKAMFLLKYATKNSQSVMYGCANYNFQYPVTVAETGVKRVIVATTQAANILVGSRLMYGTATSSPDRIASMSYNIFDGLKVLSKSAYDGSNTAITVDATTAFDTAVGTYVSTSPWGTGACDTVEGDGSPTSNTTGMEPFVLQGIEMMLGMNEALGDVVLQSTGSGWQIYTNPDSKNEATSVTADYVPSGKYSPSGAADGAQYPVAPAVANSMLFGTGSGGSTTTGVCDQVWASATTATGTREWLSGGVLSNGGLAGLWYASLAGSITFPNWSTGSRLSAIGRGVSA